MKAHFEKRDLYPSLASTEKEKLKQAIEAYGRGKGVVARIFSDHDWNRWESEANDQPEPFGFRAPRYDSITQDALSLRRVYEAQGAHHSFTFFYGLAEMRKEIDESIEEKRLAARRAEQQKNWERARELEEKQKAERKIEEEKHNASKVKDALERYRYGQGQLRFHELSPSAVMTQLILKSSSQDEDLPVLREIIKACGKKPVSIELDRNLEALYPIQLKAALWLAENCESFEIKGSLKDDDFRALKREMFRKQVCFSNLRVSQGDVLDFLTAKEVFVVEYNAAQDSYNIGYNTRIPKMVFTPVDGEYSAEAVKTASTLIEGYKERAFEVAFQGNGFNPAILPNNPNIRMLNLTQVSLTVAHVECLRKFRNKFHQNEVVLSACTFENIEAKHAFFRLVNSYNQVFRLDNALTKELDEYSAAYPHAVRVVEKWVTRFREGELSTQDLHAERDMCKIMYGLGDAASLGFKGRDAEAFDTIKIIAKIYSEPANTLTTFSQWNPAALSALRWILKETPQELVVTDVDSLEHFTEIMQSVNTENKRRVKFKNLLKLPASALSACVQLGGAQMEYDAAQNAWFVEFQSGAVVSPVTVIRLCGHNVIVGMKDVEALCKQSPHDVELRFEKNSFASAINLRDLKIVKLSFNGQMLTAVHIESLRAIPQGQLRNIEATGLCFDTDETKLQWFAFLRSITSVCAVELKDEKLYGEFHAYTRTRNTAERIQQFIEKFKQNTLTYADIADDWMFGREFLRDLQKNNQGKGLSDELRALYQIVEAITYERFPVNHASNAITLRMAEWFCEFGKTTTPVGCVTKVEDFKRLEAARKRNVNPQNVMYTLDLAQEGLCEAVRNMSPATSLDYDAATNRCTMMIDNHGLGGVVKITGEINAKRIGVVDQLMRSISFAHAVSFEKGNVNVVSADTFANPHLISLTFNNQVITAAHVAALQQTKNLCEFRATNCTFDEPETKMAFVRAVLGNPRLTMLELGCGLVRKHLDEVVKHLITHPQLEVVKIPEMTNGFNAGEDADMLQWLDYHEKMARFAKSDITAGLKLLSELGHNARFSPIWKDRQLWLEPCRSCVQKLEFHNPETFPEQLKTLRGLLELGNALTKEEIYDVLQLIVDTAASCPAVSEEVVEELVELARKEALNNEKIVAAQRVMLIGKMRDLDVAIETLDLVDVVAKLRSLEEYMSRLRLQGKEWEPVERLYDFVVRIGERYIKEQNRLSCESTLLVFLTNVVLRDISRAGRAQTIIVGIVQMRILDMMKVITKNNLSPVHREFIGKLGVPTLRDMLEIMDVYLQNGSFSREMKHKLSEFRGWIENNIRRFTPVASAPAKAKVMADGEGEFSKPAPEDKQVVSAPAVVTPPIGEPFRLSRQEAPLAVAPPLLSNEPPVRVPEYQQPQPGVVPAPAAYVPPAPLQYGEAQNAAAVRERDSTSPLRGRNPALAPQAEEPRKKKTPSKKVAVKM